MFRKPTVLTDKNDEYLFIKIEESCLKWDQADNKRENTWFIELTDFSELRRFARSNKNDF